MMFKTFGSGLLAAALAVSASPEAAADCKPNLPATAPDSRFTDNGDGTVTDQRTGLMWKQCAEGLSSTGAACDTGTATPFDWQQALQRAAQVNDGGGFAGHTDWRVPNRNEIASLIEYRCEPAINANYFFPASSWGYWSSSPDAGAAGKSWYVYMRYGSIEPDARSTPHYVRLVRGGS